MGRCRNRIWAVMVCAAVIFLCADSFRGSMPPVREDDSFSEKALPQELPEVWQQMLL